MVELNPCLLWEPKSICWFVSTPLSTLMWMKEWLFYWWWLWWLNSMSTLSEFDRLLVLWVSRNVDTGEGLQTTECSMLYCHIKEVFVLEKTTFPMYACWVFPPSNLFICRNKVLFVLFALLIIDFSVANYSRGSFQEKGGGWDRLSTSLLYICRGLSPASN